MSCSSGKCKTAGKCGCEDQGLTTPLSCTTGTPECPTPDPCSETFSSGCVVYTGDTIVDLGIEKGDRLTEIIQRLGMLILNPGCMTPTGTCLSVLNVRSTLITTSTIKLAWDPSTTATVYQVEYKEASALSWLLNPTVALSATPVDTIGGLTPATSYHIRVKATCSAGACYSLTILVTTKTL